MTRGCQGFMVFYIYKKTKKYSFAQDVVNISHAYRSNDN